MTEERARMQRLAARVAADDMLGRRMVRGLSTPHSGGTTFTSRAKIRT